MTVYKELNVGTAKPPLSERDEIIHFGIDCCDLEDEFNVSEFCTLVQNTLQKYERVIIVGGTHYYISALLQPLAPLPQRDKQVRESISKIEDKYNYLSTVDPITAERLHPNDLVRIERAIEVYLITQTPMSTLLLQTPKKPLIDTKLFILENNNLRHRIRKRIGSMVQNGYLEEAEMIFENYKGTEKPLKSFSYLPLLAYFDGKKTLTEALWEVEKGTWHLARKQRTWIKKINKERNCIYECKQTLREEALSYLCK